MGEILATPGGLISRRFVFVLRLCAMLWLVSGRLPCCGKIVVACHVVVRYRCLPCCGKIHLACHVVARYGSSAMLVTLEHDVRKSPRTRGQSLAGYDLCHCLGAVYCFTAFMHIKLLVVRRHAHALKFPRLACMPNLYCIS